MSENHEGPLEPAFKTTIYFHDDIQKYLIFGSSNILMGLFHIKKNNYFSCRIIVFSITCLIPLVGETYPSSTFEYEFIWYRDWLYFLHSTLVLFFLHRHSLVTFFSYWSAAKSLTKLRITVVISVWRHHQIVHENLSPPRKNRRHFSDDVFRCISVNGKFCILVQISLKFGAMGPIDNNPTLIHIMDCCQIGDKPLSQLMLTQFTDAYMWH